MDGIDARVPAISPGGPLRASVTTFGALIWSGFRRYATYRQATVAGTFTNIVFGFIRCYVLLAVAEASPAGRAGGYDAAQLATFVWVGQGLLTVVGLWGWSELHDRIRSGDVVADLLRPIPPVTAYLAADLGRGLHGVVTRLGPPIVVGLIFFPFAVPRRPLTVPLFALSVILALICCFACRFLVNAVAYWLHDARGPIVLWALGAGVLSGLYFPLRLLPEPVATALWLCTPFPGLLQTPLDVLVERDPQVGLVALQAFWAVLLLWSARQVQRRAERKLVVQGG